MQIQFNRWCMDPKGRTPVSVDPTCVEATEHHGDAFAANFGSGYFPAATKLIMKNKTIYFVQGTLAEVVEKLNVNFNTILDRVEPYVPVAIQDEVRAIRKKLTN